MCQSQTLSQALDYLKSGHTITHPDLPGHLEGVKTKAGDLIIIHTFEDPDTDSIDHEIWEPTQADVLATDWDVQ
jgi:hypothetical protein